MARVSNVGDKTSRSPTDAAATLRSAKPSHHATESRIAGSLIGLAVGDAMGLAYEGLSPRRATRLLGPPSRYRLLFGRGMVSDDTEHACLVAQSLIASGGDVDGFRRQLSRRLKFWLLGIPAGVGFATLRSIVRLWLGCNPKMSGVFSAGNGPAMRAPIVGAAIDDVELMRHLVEDSTRMTHADPKALRGALAVSLAARMACENERVSPAGFADRLTSFLDAEAGEFLSLVHGVVRSVDMKQPTLDYAKSVGLQKGVSGYVYHTVPIVLHAWLSHQGDFRSAVTAVVRCGGDTDTTAAIVGGIVGASVGFEWIPAEWIHGLWEWPRSVTWMRKLTAQLHVVVNSGSGSRPLRLPAYGIVPRNLLFLFVVLCHGLRRLLPPY
jgi:ADP-ribosyl-[dinitrogen reductase] hydrolase